MSDTQIVTIANRWPTEPYYCYHSLFRSVGSNEILVLGQQQGEYTGLSDKPRILYHAIKNGKITSKNIVFVDAFDVVFADTLDNIMDKFESFNSSIVIGAEKNCFPSNFKKEYDKLYENSQYTSSYRYLNSGVIIGETEAILEVLEAMDAPNLPVDYHDGRTSTNFHFNDQAMYMDLCLRQPVTMELDYECEIAQNMQGVEEGELDFSTTNIRNIETGNFPSIIHWNGGSKDKWSMPIILKHLNLL